MKTGRNDPCPCGSGKKYKKCCANRPAPSMLQDMKEDIHDLIGSQSFGSIEEVQGILDQYQQQKKEALLRNSTVCRQSRCINFSTRLLQDVCFPLTH